MTHDGRNPQVDLVRRYARILRSAPAEAMRIQQERSLHRAGASRSIMARTDPTGSAGAASTTRRATPA